MRRRDFVKVIGGAVAALLLTARAQQPALLLPDKDRRRWRRASCAVIE
jgi:hypothetical protein